MKTLHIGKFTQTRSGGMEVSIYGLCRFLAKTHDVELLVCSEDGENRRERSGRMTVSVLPAWLVLSSAPIFPDLISRLWRPVDFDLLQISLQNPMAVIAYLLTRPRSRLVAWYHHDIVRQKLVSVFFAPLQRMFLRRADAIVATSEAYARSSSTLREFRDKVRVIHLGIDVDKFADVLPAAQAIRARYGAPLIVFVGRLVYYKGLPYLVEAMRGLSAKLLIVGTGPMENELRALAKNLGLDGKIFFEKVPHDQSIAPYWQACDIGVLPSTERTEAFGLSLIEAMACGKPVVATELGTGTSFVCQHEINGLVVAPKDVSALRAALARLIEDPSLAKRLGEMGRRRARAEFSIEAEGKAFVELYKQLLGQEC